MTDKEKIRAEIARMQDRLMDENSNFRSDYDEGAYNVLCELDAYCDSLPEEPSKDLEEESYHAVMRMLNNHDLILPSTTNAQLCTAYQKFYKEAANWQKEQMMKDATEYSLYADGDFVTIDHDFSEDGYKSGDKVKVIIIKEAEK